MQLGERLKTLRTESGLLQSDMAKKMNKSLNAYKRWESGMNEPSISDLIEMSDFFNVSIDYLVGRSNDRIRQNPDPTEMKLKPELRGQYLGVVEMLQSLFVDTDQVSEDVILEAFKVLAMYIRYYLLSSNVSEDDFVGIRPDVLPLERIKERLSEMENKIISPFRVIFTTSILETFQLKRMLINETRRNSIEQDKSIDTDQTKTGNDGGNINGRDN